MRLNKYRQFVFTFRPSEQHVFHYAVIAERYFYLAETQAEAFQDAIESAFAEGKEHTEASEKRYSFGFGVYTMLRTCLESAQRLSGYFDTKYHDKGLAEFRVSWDANIKRIVDIANDLIKHPLENPSRNKDTFYEPGGSDSTGALTVYGYSMDADKDMILPEIHPVGDLNLIYQYLEGLGERYLLLLPPQSGD